MMNERVMNKEMMSDVKVNRQRFELNEMELEEVAGGSMWNDIEKLGKTIGDWYKSLWEED